MTTSATIKPATTATVTDDEIDAAITAALADAGAIQRPVRWATIARRVPGTPWQQEMALVRLWNAWKIYALKIRGRLHLSLSDETDALIAAKQLGTSPRVMPVLP